MPARTISHIDPALVDVKRMNRHGKGRRAAQAGLSPAGGVLGGRRGPHGGTPQGGGKKGDDQGVEDGPYSTLIMQVCGCCIVFRRIHILVVHTPPSGW